MQLPDVEGIKETLTAHEVHDHLECLSLVCYQRSGVSGDLALGVEVAQCFHPGLKYLNRDAAFNRIQTLDDAGLDGPPQCELLLKLLYLRLIPDEVTIRHPLLMNGMKVLPAEVTPMRRQIRDPLPLVRNCL